MVFLTKSLIIYIRKRKNSVRKRTFGQRPRESPVLSYSAASTTILQPRQSVSEKPKNVPVSLWTSLKKRIIRRGHLVVVLAVSIGVGWATSLKRYLKNKNN